MARSRTFSSRNRSLSTRALGHAFSTVLGEISERQLPSAARACAHFVQRAGLVHRAPLILAALDEALLAEQGLLRVPLAAAEPLAKKDQADIETALEAIVGSPVRVQVSLRSKLLAGFRAESDGLLIDASLLGALARLRARWHTSAASSTSFHA